MSKCCSDSSWNLFQRCQIVFQVQLNELYRLVRSDFRSLERCSQKMGNTWMVKIEEWSLSSPLSTTHRLQIFWSRIRTRNRENHFCWSQTRCIRMGTPGPAQSKRLIRSKWQFNHKPLNNISEVNFCWPALTWLVCLRHSGLDPIEESKSDLWLRTFQETEPESSQNNLLRLRSRPIRGRIRVRPDGL